MRPYHCHSSKIKGQPLKVCVYNSRSVDDTAALVARMAKIHAKDNYTINQSRRLSMRQLFDHLHQIYRIEKGEILQSPRITDLIRRADCDDQTIYALAVLLAQGVRQSDLRIYLAGNKRITHIFPAVRQADGSWLRLDMLPHLRWQQNYRWPIERYKSLDQY